MQIEEEYKYLEEQCLKKGERDHASELHSLAMITLYNFALNMKLSGSQLITLLYALEKGGRLHQNLIAPYLLLLDDMELVCKHYGYAYLRFLSEKTKNRSDEEIMEILFTNKVSEKGAEG